MPTLRSSRRPKAPPNRVYSTAPRLTQRRFPARRRVVTSSADFTAFSKTTLQKQETLTQIGFGRILPDSDEESGGEEIMDAAIEDDDMHDVYEDPTRRKRRRPSADDENEDNPRLKRQSTLTQIGFFSPSDDLDMDDSPLFTNDENNPPNDLGTRLSHAHTSPAPPVKLESRTSPFQNTPLQPVLAPSRQATPLFKTPNKPIKREIPSSQSPDATPVSIHRSNYTSTASPSPFKQRARTPLQAIEENVLATRDSGTPTEKVKKTAAAATPQPTQCTSSANEDDDMDLDFCDQENQDPSSQYKAPEEPSSSKKLLQQLDEYSKQLKHNSSASPFRRPSPLAPSSYHTASHSSQLKTARPAATATTSFSQATTVDITQPPHSYSHSRSHSRSSTPHPTVRTPLSNRKLSQSQSQPPSLSQSQPLPDSLALLRYPSTPSAPALHPQFSIYSDEDPDAQDSLMRHFDLGTCSPLSSVQDSAEVVTVSQLLGGLE